MKRLLATCLLLWITATVGATAAAADTQSDLNAFKDLQQSKWDAQKELQQKDVEALRLQIAAVDKRVDDQLAQVGQAVDRFGVTATLAGLIVTTLLVFGGLLGFRNAKTEAREVAMEQANQSAKDWFDAQAKALTNRIDELEKKAADVHQQMDDSAQRVRDKEASVTDALSTSQNMFDQPRSSLTPAQEAAQHVLTSRSEELKNSAEQSYSFEDWNTRAHTAYRDRNIEGAAYFWRKAADVPNAGAINVARVLLNRGIAQGQLNQIEAAIATYDEMVHRFGDATEPALREQVANALGNKANLQDEFNQNEAAISTFAEVMRRFGDTTEPAILEKVAKALMNKAHRQSQHNLHEAAIATYEEVARLLGNANEFALRELVANALGNRGNLQGQLNQSEAAIASFDEVVHRFGDSSEPALRELVAKALRNKGFFQAQFSQNQAAIATFDEVVHRFGDSGEPALRELVAKAFISKGVALDQLNQRDAAITVYSEVVRRFGDATETGLREQIATALVNKGFCQGQLNQNEAANATYGEVVRRFGEATEPALRELVAWTFIAIGHGHDRLKQSEAAIATYDEVMRRFGSAPEPSQRERVAIAMNGAGFHRLLQAKRFGPTTSHGQESLHAALGNLNIAVSRWPQPNGMYLGNRAYANYLLGHTAHAEADFAAALRTADNGGRTIYEMTLKDLSMHPIPEDDGMRALVERAWADYQQETDGSATAA